MIKFQNHLALADFMSVETANKTFQQKLNNWAVPPPSPYVIKSRIKLKLNCLSLSE